jgi:ATP-binding cassette, subfamily C (CFTR/MRP), member 1
MQNSFIVFIFLGKSSLLQALFRFVELRSGKIEIDGVNIADIGLDTLRHGLALVPQDPVLFLGTIRENMYVTLSSISSKLT